MSDFQVRFPFRWNRINPHKPDRDKTFMFLTVELNVLELGFFLMDNWIRQNIIILNDAVEF